jgi:hypothetical protein
LHVPQIKGERERERKREREKEREKEKERGRAREIYLRACLRSEVLYVLVPLVSHSSPQAPSFTLVPLQASVDERRAQETLFLAVSKAILSLNASSSKAIEGVYIVVVNVIEGVIEKAVEAALL